MTTDTRIAQRDNGSIPAALAEKVLLGGDLSKLTPPERLNLYQKVCESLGLNPLTQPFGYIPLNGKLTLYAKRDATDQLRKLHHVSISKVERERLDDVLVVTAHASLPDGRTDMEIGVVSLKGLGGEFLANAYMKAMTKAKRRVTLSIVGLGWLDETEVETIPDARPVEVNVATGEIVEAPPPKHERTQRSDTAQQAEVPAQHPEGSVEWYWARWRKLVEQARTLGLVTPSDPPEHATAVQIRGYCDGLFKRLEREQGAPVSEASE